MRLGKKIRRSRRYRRKRGLWKGIILYAAVLALIIILLPALLVNIFWKKAPGIEQQKEAGPETAEPDPELDGDDIMLNVFDARQEELLEMGLDEYLVGVVAAEMPAGFYEEALKAQAVAARTYALHRAHKLGGSGCSGHPEADLCTDSTCCQAWVGEEEMSARWPSENSREFHDRVGQAVAATRGMVVTYEETLAQTLYHSTCGGMTEAAGNVWDGRNPHYLQAVNCPYCKHSRHYRDEMSMELSDYASALKNKAGVLPVPVMGDANVLHMEVVSSSPSGRNLLIRLGDPGHLFSGTKVRSMLDLPSTHFQWHLDNNHIIFETKGFGHGVGLCQYGADGMAGEGKSYEEILTFYYRDTKVSRWTP